MKPEEPPSLPQTKITRAQKGPKRHVAPYPGATCTLARPFLELSGRRHVPVLVNANRVAFLRLKKPQPPFLSRIIRDTVETRERRIAEAARLASEIPIAEDEGDWDEILYKHVGLDYGDPKETPWECEVKRAFEKNHKLQVEAVKKRADVSAKMYAIMEQEKALAEEEKLRIRDEKHKVRKARRLARRGMIESEIQKKLYSQAEKTITPDAPAETEEVTKLGQEEVRQPNTKWRKRGDKYKTSDELKQLYEASLRPKTAEEVAKIKEARTRRKEEKAVLKDERRKRKQGNTAYWQRLNDEAKHSTNKPLGSDKEENLDKKAVPLKPAATLAVGRMDYGRMRLSPLVEDDPSTADKTEPPKFTILRPSYLKEKSKYP